MNNSNTHQLNGHALQARLSSPSFKNILTKNSLTPPTNGHAAPRQTNSASSSRHCSPLAFAFTQSVGGAVPSPTTAPTTLGEYPVDTNDEDSNSSSIFGRANDVAADLISGTKGALTSPSAKGGRRPGGRKRKLETAPDSLKDNLKSLLNLTSGRRPQSTSEIVQNLNIKLNTDRLNSLSASSSPAIGSAKTSPEMTNGSRKRNRVNGGTVNETNQSLINGYHHYDDDSRTGFEGGKSHQLASNSRKRKAETGNNSLPVSPISVFKKSRLDNFSTTSSPALAGAVNSLIDDDNSQSSSSVSSFMPKIKIRSPTRPPEDDDDDDDDEDDDEEDDVKKTKPSLSTQFTVDREIETILAQLPPIQAEDLEAAKEFCFDDEVADDVGGKWDDNEGPEPEVKTIEADSECMLGPQSQLKLVASDESGSDWEEYEYDEEYDEEVDEEIEVTDDDNDDQLEDHPQQPQEDMDLVNSDANENDDDDDQHQTFLKPANDIDVRDISNCDTSNSNASREESNEESEEENFPNSAEPEEEEEEDSDEDDFVEVSEEKEEEKVKDEDDESGLEQADSSTDTLRVSSTVESMEVDPKIKEEDKNDDEEKEGDDVELIEVSKNDGNSLNPLTSTNNTSSSLPATTTLNIKEELKIEESEEKKPELNDEDKEELTEPISEPVKIVQDLEELEDDKNTYLSSPIYLINQHFLFGPDMIEAILAEHDQRLSSLSSLDATNLNDLVDDKQKLNEADEERISSEDERHQKQQQQSNSSNDDEIDSGVGSDLQPTIIKPKKTKLITKRVLQKRRRRIHTRLRIKRDLVDRIANEKWEHMNGTYDKDGCWRDFGEMTSVRLHKEETKPETEEENVLHILPYVNCTW